LFVWTKNGRPRMDSNIDLFRVKVRLNHTYNNFDVRGETAKPL